MKQSKIREWLKAHQNHILDSILNSYSQVFFATYKPFALLILLVSFIDVYTGLMGLLAVITNIAFAYILNLDENYISKGLYGFNALLVGLGLGIYYSLSWPLVFIVILAAIFTLLVSTAVQGIMTKYHLPFLSIPFLISLWIFIIASKYFEALGISERGIYTMNELYTVGGHSLVKIYEYFNQLNIPAFIKGYFISLSAILFQYNVLVGFLISVGLLFFSRIAFLLSLLGFFIAYLFYSTIEANITMIEYSYIGFNYILTAIALGGFFLVPSTRSFISVGVMVPLVAILSISLSVILWQFGLPIYSLPFNVVVLLFLYILKYRMTYSRKLSEVIYQYNQPEKNLYAHLNNIERFKHLEYLSVKLPFMGIWKVSQGHNGEYTHQGNYAQAWDFIITNQKGDQFKNDGDIPDDYFCYNKPVLAPADGTIEEVVDNIDDNIIGEVNLHHNWGNTIIIKHNDLSYSKLSHLLKDSSKVKKGDNVKQGQVIAHCGNSGRSPYPHLHFQVQSTPFIGSASIFNPIRHYLVMNEKNATIHSLDVPQKDELIANIDNSPLIEKAFNWSPGRTLKFKVENHELLHTVEWKIKINANNETYLECQTQKARAYFISDNDIFRFTYYEGRKYTILHRFFLALFKIQKCYYPQNSINDTIAVHQSFNNITLWLTDFISPFIKVTESVFQLDYLSSNDMFSPTEIQLQSTVANLLVRKMVSQGSSHITITSSGLEQVAMNFKDEEIILRQIPDNNDI